MTISILDRNGRIYVVGGGSYCTTSGPLTTVEVYAPSTNSWGVAASLPRGVASTAAVTGSDGRIYVFGAVTPGGICGTDIPLRSTIYGGPALFNSNGYFYYFDRGNGAVSAYSSSLDLWWR